MCWLSELCCEKVPEQNSHLKTTSILKPCEELLFKADEA